MTVDKNLIKLIESGEYVVVSVKAPRGLLSSTAMRDDHSFWAPCPDDKTILEMRQAGDFMGNTYKTTSEKENILRGMEKLHEEVVGTGFYKYEKIFQ